MSAEEWECHYCPNFQHAIEVVGRRWSASIIRAIGPSSLRFGEVRSQIPGLSDRMLDTRLTELEGEGIVTRTIEDNTSRYSLTDKGKDLEPVLASIVCWASSWSEKDDTSTPGRRRC